MRYRYGSLTQLLTLLDITTMTAATAEQNWCWDTAATGAARRRESAQKWGSREVTEKDRSWWEGGHDELFYSAGALLPHRQSRYRKLRALTAQRPHVRILITAPCPRRTSGLISRRQLPACGTPSTASGRPLTQSARYKVSKRGWQNDTDCEGGQHAYC